MRFRTLALSGLFAISSFGCAATRGAVLTKSDPTHAHVRLGKNEVAVADTVRLYRLDCYITPQRSERCTKRTIAEGRVAEVRGDDDSVVTFPQGTEITEGARVEKVQTAAGR